MRHNIDFTRGNITSEIIQFAVPIALGELLQNLYNSVDSLVVGNFVGDDALAAVSVCGTLSHLLIGFFTGVSVGASVIVSRAFGGQDEKRLGTCVATAFTFSATLGVLLSILGIISTPFLVWLVDVPGSVRGLSVTYLRIYLAGILFTIIYNVGAGILRAVGDSRSPFYFLVVSCCLNIVLDLLFVAVLPWGVMGVAAATVCAQFVSVVCVYYKIKSFCGRDLLDLRGAWGQKHLIGDIVSVSFPAGLQNSLISLSNLFVWRYVNGFDTAAMAGVGVAQRLDRFVAIPSRSIGLSLTTFVSQNDGANDTKRAYQGFRRCLGLALAATLIVSVPLYAFSDTWVGLFNQEHAVIQVGSAMMRTLIPFYGLMALREIMLGMMRGYGDTKIPMALSLVGMVVIRQIYLAISMGIDRNVANIYYCYPITWGVTVVLVMVYYALGYRDGRPKSKNMADF